MKVYLPNTRYLNQNLLQVTVLGPSILALQKRKAGKERQCSQRRSQHQDNTCPFSFKQGGLEMNTNIFEVAMCRKKLICGNICCHLGLISENYSP